MAASVYSRTLNKAAELLGGQAKLSHYLRVPSAELQKWIDDKGIPPIGIFLRAVDLLIDETPPPADSGGPGEPPAPRDCSAGDSSATWF